MTCTITPDRARMLPVIRAMRTVTTSRLAHVCALSHERVVKAVCGWEAVDVRRAHGDTRVVWRVVG